MVFKCPKCPATFRCNQDLQRHLNRKKPCDQGKAQCEGCGSKYASEKALREHIREGRCKGKMPEARAEELADQVAELQNKLGEQERLMHLTNAVTAAAAANSATASATNLQFNTNVTVNMSINVCGIGEEQVRHLSNLSNQELRQKLNLDHSPKSLADYCAMIRADVDHAENHNALLLNAESKEMACHRGGKWSWDNKDKALLEILRCDMMRLYNQLARFESDDAAQHFRNEYLLHNLMLKSNCDDTEALRPFLGAIAKPIIELTQKCYVQTEESSMCPEEIQLHKDIQTLQQSMIDARDSLEQQQAVQRAALLSMQKTLASFSQKRLPL